MNKYYEKIQAIKSEVEKATSYNDIEQPIEMLKMYISKAFADKRSEKYINQIEGIPFFPPMYTNDQIANAKANFEFFNLGKGSLLTKISVILADIADDDEK